MLDSLLHNLSPSLLWFTSWSGTLHFILHTFLHPIIVFFLQHHCNLFCRSTEIMSSNPSLSLNPLLGTLFCGLMPHIHLTILVSACWNATSFSFLTSQISLPCNVLLCTQLLYNLPLTVNDISLLVSNGAGNGSSDLQSRRQLQAMLPSCERQDPLELPHTQMHILSKSLQNATNYNLNKNNRLY